MSSVNNKNLDISIIIVNYNSGMLLYNCIESIVKYTENVSYEIIVVDNNSTDNSINKVLNKYEKVLILLRNEENKGFATANNQAFKKAKGEYILFLNNDTIFIENSVKKCLEFIEKRNENIILGCKLLNKDYSLQPSVFDFLTLWNTFTSNFFLYILFPRSKYFNKYHLMNKKIDYTTEVDIVSGAFLLAKTTSILALNGFDERFYFYAEEMDLCYRHKQFGGKVIYYPETSIIHLKGETTKKNLWFLHKNRMRATIQIFQKHFKGIKFPLALVFHYIGMLIRIPILFLVGLFTFNFKYIKESYFFSKLFLYYPKNKFK